MDNKPSLREIIKIIWENREKIKQAQPMKKPTIKQTLSLLAFLIIMVGLVAFAFWQKAGFFTIVHWYVFVITACLFFLLGLAVLIWYIYLLIRKDSSKL